MRATKHGKCYSPVYRIYIAMRARCTNPNHSSYADYGGRGIRVHPDFATFEGFYAHVGDRPPGMTLDRIDHEGDYEPGNVRWATRQIQSRNTRSNIFLTFQGKRQSIIDWSEELGINQCVIKNDLLKGLLKGKPVDTIMASLLKRKISYAAR